MRARVTILVVAAGLAVAADPPDPRPPEELIRLGNEAYLRGDLDAAERHYGAAAERTTDPGLVAFNRAAVAVQNGEMRAGGAGLPAGTRRPGRPAGPPGEGPVQPRRLPAGSRRVGQRLPLGHRLFRAVRSTCSRPATRSSSDARAQPGAGQAPLGQGPHHREDPAEAERPAAGRARSAAGGRDRPGPRNRPERPRRSARGAAGGGPRSAARRAAARDEPESPRGRQPPRGTRRRPAAAAHPGGHPGDLAARWPSDWRRTAGRPPACSPDRSGPMSGIGEVGARNVSEGLGKRPSLTLRALTIAVCCLLVAAQDRPSVSQLSPFEQQAKDFYHAIASGPKGGRGRVDGGPARRPGQRRTDPDANRPPRRQPARTAQAGPAKTRRVHRPVPGPRPHRPARPPDAAEVRFTYGLRPRSTDVKEIPSLRYVYFRRVGTDWRSFTTFASSVPVIVTAPAAKPTPAAAPVPLDAPEEFFTLAEERPTANPGRFGWLLPVAAVPVAVVVWVAAVAAAVPGRGAAGEAAAEPRRSPRAGPAEDGPHVRRPGRGRGGRVPRLPVGAVRDAAGRADAGRGVGGAAAVECPAERAADAEAFLRACDAARFTPPPDDGLSLTLRGGVADHRRGRECGGMKRGCRCSCAGLSSARPPTLEARSKQRRSGRIWFLDGVEAPGGRRSRRAEHFAGPAQWYDEHVGRRAPHRRHRPEPRPGPLPRRQPAAGHPRLPRRSRPVPRGTPTCNGRSPPPVRPSPTRPSPTPPSASAPTRRRRCGTASRRGTCSSPRRPSRCS